MGLLRLEVDGLRNLAPAVLEPGPGLNLIIGPNASGKSSLLEAIFLLGRGRSFRGARAGQMITHGAEALTVSGRIEAGARLHLGLRFTRGQREIRLGGRPVSASSELLRAFPLLIIQPAGIALLEGAPRLRRQFLDFGVFHRDPDYLSVWRHYTRALIQRNALLRAGGRGLAPWDEALARYGIMMHSARADYLEQLLPVLREIGGRFFADARFELRLHAGWDARLELAEVLRREVDTDLRHGHTHCGPHKGDFVLLLDQHPVKSHASRGQMKLLVYALLLAQARLMEEHLGAAGCVLVDDVASELDDANRRTLLRLLGERTAQLFITATSRASLEEGLSADAALWRMAAGRITPA